jgi:glyoxylase-like metal-dependent hydrolase (beta-lactamase superfamily II)
MILWLATSSRVLNFDDLASLPSASKPASMQTIYTAPGLTVYQSALFQTNATIIQTDHYVLVVDPNWLPQEVEFLYQTAEAAGAGKEKYLLFTHSDYDHIIGYGRFAAYTTIASQNFVDNPEPEAALAGIRKFDDEYYIQRSYEITYPKIDLAIGGEGERLQIGNDHYQFFQARGHNRDGLIAWLPERGIVVAGDYLCAVEFPYLYDSYEHYLKTLTTLENILLKKAGFKQLIVGHGPVAIQTDEVKNRLAAARSYLTELLSSVREDRVFPLAEWLGKYDFPGIMAKFHAGNVELVKNANH